LKDYGTGAIMAVPGDDERDNNFAKHHQLPIIEIIDRSASPSSAIADRQGTLMNSTFLDGQKIDEAISTMLEYLVKHGLGVRQVEYKLRDANFSRQRYWGEPFPIFYGDDQIAHDLPDFLLPHFLPDLDDFKPSPDGRSPLARNTRWANPKPGVHFETDTMPGYAGSSWYFIRYMDPHNAARFASRIAIDYWKDVDLYVGGVEHAVGHLMYSRFWHKFLLDLGLVPTDEPFKKIINQGMIQGIVENVVMMKAKKDGKSHFISYELVTARGIPDDQLSYLPVHIDFVTNYGHPDSHLNAEGIKAFVKWRPEYENAWFETIDGLFELEKIGNGLLYTFSEVGKMSKRYHNVVNPNDVIEKYGADCFRMYEMFLGPVEQSKPWDTMGIEGVSKFLRKFWSLYFNEEGDWIVDHKEPKEESMRSLHATIKKTAEDIERFSFNTAISQFMICVNELRKQDEHSAAVLEPLSNIMAPLLPSLPKRSGQDSVIPPLCTKHYSRHMMNNGSPVTSVFYPVCINGKKRSEIELPLGLSNDVIEQKAKELPEIIKWMDGKPIRKVIIVPDKMINIVI
jgi:leucyl-tRNA synthetase